MPGAVRVRLVNNRGGVFLLDVRALLGKRRPNRQRQGCHGKGREEHGGQPRARSARLVLREETAGGGDGPHQGEVPGQRAACKRMEPLDDIPYHSGGKH